MSQNVLTDLIDLLDQKMYAAKDDEKAVNMAKYLKDRFVCYGIKSPVRNEIQRAWFNEVKKHDINHWDLIYNLWAKDQREYHYIAVDYLNKLPVKEIEKNDYKKIEELITTNSWWDSVDSIASNFTGKYFRKYPEMKKKVIVRWRNSDNMWLNRTTLIFQLKYKDDVDFELLKDLILQFQPVKEFFIQKAIGWSLRQYSKYNPAAVKDFVKTLDLSTVAKREAYKYI